MRKSTLLALLVALVLGACGAAGAIDPGMLAFLRTHPTDRKAVVAHLKAALAARDDASAFVAGRYLEKRLGVKNAKLDDVLAECARRLGKPDKAREYFQAALLLKPGDARATAGLAALGENVVPPGAGSAGVAAAPSVSVSTGGPAVAGSATGGDYQEALRYFYEDRYQRSSTSLKKVIEADQHHMGARLLLARILMGENEYGTAEALLAGVVKDDPANVEAQVRMASVMFETGRVEQGEQEYKKALAMDPKNPLALIEYALHLTGMHRAGEAAQFFDQARSQGPFKDRELVIDSAAMNFAQGRTDDALAMVKDYQRSFGDNSDSLMLEGFLLVKAGHKEEAAESLAQSVQRNPGNLTNAFRIIPLLVTLGFPQQALMAIDAVDGAYPGDQRILKLRQQIEMRVVTDQDMVTRRDGPFEFTYPRPLTQERGNPVEAIAGYFKEAQGAEAKLMGFRPEKVAVKIHYLTGIDNPAYYSPEEDDVTIAGGYYIAHDSTANLPLTQDQYRAFGEHMVLHEYAHMAFAHAMGYDAFKAATKAGRSEIPQWLLEGIAEWAAGGEGALPRTAGELAALFKDGYLDEGQMVRATTVLTLSKNHTDSLKAYVQSFYIVKYLIRQKGDAKAGMPVFLEFCKGLMQAQAFDVSLQQHYGLTHEQFTQGWHAQIKGDLIDAAVPRLASIDPVGAAENPSHTGIEGKGAPIAK